MAKPNYSFQKRQKELARKKKKELKRRRKLEKQQEGSLPEGETDAGDGAAPPLESEESLPVESDPSS
jgi:hypothetical protein